MSFSWFSGWPISNIYSPAGKYNGLINQGATCYLNSVLQVLFMTEDFKEAVQRCENPGSKFIDRQLQNLFEELNTKTAHTKNITDKLDIKRVYEQRDAAEYYEKILNLTSDEASQIFHGTLTHRTLCSGCGEQNDTDGKFWHLPLPLMDSYSEYSVVNGIEEYFRASVFSGENQMYCDRCDDKRDATVGCVLKHHPEVLTLLLKRFEFDYNAMTFFKIERTVHVPLMLQIDNQRYELYAFVEHVGNLRSGHYTAAIKPQDDDRWYDFNDARVTPISNQPFQSENFMRSSSAYLLFYRKRNAGAADVCTSEGSSTSTGDVYDQHQDAAMVNEEEEMAPEEEGDRNEVAITIEPEKETAVRDFEDRVGVHSEVERQSPETSLKEDVENLREGLHKLQDKQTDQVQLGENARTDMKAEQDFLSKVCLHTEGVEDKAYEELKRQQKNINPPVYDQTCEQEVRKVHVRQKYPHQDYPNIEREKEQGVKRHQEGKEEETEQTEQNQDNEGLNDVRQDMDEPTSKRVKEKMLEDDVKGKTRAEKLDSRSEKHLSGSDLALKASSNDSRDADNAQNTFKNDQDRRLGGSCGYGRREQERQRKDADEREMKQKRRSDKHSQRGGSPKPLTDSDVRSSDGGSQRGSEIHVRHSKQNVDVAARQDIKGDGDLLRGRDGSSIRRAGSAKSRKTSETLGREREGNSEDTVEETRFSKNLQVRIIEDETRHTSTITIRSREITEMELDTNKTKKKNFFSRFRCSHSKKDSSGMFKKFRKMKITEPKQKRSAERGIEELQEEGQEEHFNTKRVKKVEAGEQTALKKDETKRANKNREKKKKEMKKKRNRKTLGCFPFSFKKQTSDSD